ncbi:unnamed protein product, partial [Pylaiella littoralis]
VCFRPKVSGHSVYTFRRVVGAQARFFKCRINEVIDRGGRYNGVNGAPPPPSRLVYVARRARSLLELSTKKGNAWRVAGQAFAFGSGLFVCVLLSKFSWTVSTFGHVQI